MVKPKPVFNQPVATDRRYCIARALYGVFLVLLVMLAAAMIGLKATTINFIEDNRNTGFVFDTGELETVIMAALPRQLYTAPAKLALVASVISVFLGVGQAAIVFMDWKEGKKTQAYTFRRNVMFLHFTNSIIILMALVSLYVTHKSSSHFSERYINNKAERPSSEDGMRYNRGTFDLETWSCELQDVDGARMVQEDYGKQCVVEMAGRAMMIPFLVVGCVLAGLSIWSMIGGARDADGERMKTELVEVEMGKMNAV
ncbi:hypothetical protein K458DRAFT_438480 [Lentithecium fluviatile CBS 122367]|uniref:Uncharacterized protein n=1 Tax=Lentithecium fluviatile CBS 122367 TaxID=1168545 RepID=A0A6G1JK52_9PLEO|nr:hypothetical protein K458DRAFT_438480 [Lentithecium fluviatile CBS 122367]